MVQAAYLHDVIEDCTGVLMSGEWKRRRCSNFSIREEFSEGVYGLVLEVTHTDSQVFPNLRSLDGYILKFADRLANLSRRQGGLNDKEIKRYMEKSVFWSR